MAKCSILMSLAVLFLAAFAASGVLANPDPPAYTTFKTADFEDIYLTPVPGTGGLQFVLIVGPTPKVKLNAVWHQVKWVQSYFLVSQDEESDFTATNGTTVTDWFWESKGVPGRIAGWVGSGSTRIYPQGNKPLGFSTLNTNGNAVKSGLHIGYDSGGTEMSDWYKAALPPVPEPSGWLALAVWLPSAIWLKRRTAK